MATEKVKCRVCGDVYHLSENEQSMKDEGYWSRESEVCNDCFDMQNTGRDMFYEMHSDSDLGL